MEEINAERAQEATKIRCAECDRDFASQEALDSHNLDKHGIKKVDNDVKQEKPKVNVYKVLTIALFAFILIAGFILLKSNGPTLSGNGVSEDGGIQKVDIGFSNGYTPNTIRVKAGVPVEITLDNSVKGCFRSFSIKGLVTSGYYPSPSDTIKFTPTQKGTFTFQCGMGMAKGKIIVE